MTKYPCTFVRAEMKACRESSSPTKMASKCSSLPWLAFRERLRECHAAIENLNLLDDVFTVADDIVYVRSRQVRLTRGIPTSKS